MNYPSPSHAPPPTPYHSQSSPSISPMTPHPAPFTIDELPTPAVPPLSGSHDFDGNIQMDDDELYRILTNEVRGRDRRESEKESEARRVLFWYNVLLLIFLLGVMPLFVLYFVHLWYFRIEIVKNKLKLKNAREFFCANCAGTQKRKMSGDKKEQKEEKEKVGDDLELPRAVVHRLIKYSVCLLSFSL
jgi:hypothetical protein